MRPCMIISVELTGLLHDILVLLLINCGSLICNNRSKSLSEDQLAGRKAYYRAKIYKRLLTPQSSNGKRHLSDDCCSIRVMIP